MAAHTSTPWLPALSVAGSATLFALGLVVGHLERRSPARADGASPRERRRAVLADLAAFACVAFVWGPTHLFVQGRVRAMLPFLDAARAALRLPFAAQVVLVLFVNDLAVYWLHRLAHRPALWRIHRWHHTPAHLDWLSGMRASLLQIVVFSAPSFVITQLAPATLPGLAASFAFCQLYNHANVTVRWTPVSWAIVSPKAHRIHHAKVPALYDRNFGTLWTFWDRLFGTFVDEREVRDDFPLGIDEAPNPVRASVGL